LERLVFGSVKTGNILQVIGQADLTGLAVIDQYHGLFVKLNSIIRGRVVEALSIETNLIRQVAALINKIG
jgi:hypothetical protein